jgi:hypothetical protein
MEYAQLNYRGRPARLVRTLPVRELTRGEAEMLRTHAHPPMHAPSPDRRKAYLVRSSVCPEQFFNVTELARLRKWIRNEK